MPSLNVPKSKPFFFEGFMPYEARTEIFQEKGSLFGRFEFTKISFRDNLTFNGIMHGLRTTNEGINQRHLKILADVADKICFGRT